MLFSSLLLFAIGGPLGSESFDPGPSLAQEALTLEQLVRLNHCELEQLYRNAEPGAIPHGYACGKSIRWAGHRLALPTSRITGFVWHGKWFDACAGTLVNEWCLGIKAIQAQVFYGESWMDGRPAIIMDYNETSTVWRQVRDELRQIGPGPYLGAMYERKCPCPRFKMLFALQMAPCCD